MYLKEQKAENDILKHRSNMYMAQGYMDMVPKINKTNAVVVKQASKQLKKKQHSTCRDSHLVLFLSIMVYDDDTAQKHQSNNYQKDNVGTLRKNHDKRQTRETGGTAKTNRNRTFKSISSNALYIGRIGKTKPLKRQETKIDRQAFG